MGWEALHVLHLFTAVLHVPSPPLRCSDSVLSPPGEGAKEKLVPLIQGPSDTRELHTSRWLNEIRKPESLLAPDLLAFSAQVPQQGGDCRNSGKAAGVTKGTTPLVCMSKPIMPRLA